MTTNEMTGYKKTRDTAAYVLLALAVGAAVGAFVAGQPGVLLTVGLVAAALAAVTIVARVEAGLVVLLFISYLRVSDVLITNFNAPSIFRPFVAFLGLIILVRWIRYGMRDRSWIRAAVLVGVYGVVVFLSLIYANDFERAQAAFSDFWKDGVLTVLIVILMQRPASFRLAMWALIAAGIVMSTLSVVQYLTGDFGNNFYGFAQAGFQNIYGETDDYRIAGPVGDPNFYAQIILTLIPLAVNRFLYEKNLVLKLTALYAMMVMALTVMFTFSRGAALAFAVVVLLLLAYRRLRSGTVAAGLIVFVVVAQFIPALYVDRLFTVVEVARGSGDVKDEVSLRGRASEAIVAYQMFRDNPLFGVGVGNYPRLYQTYSRPLGLDPRTEERQAHNLYLEVAAETGLFGLTVFLLILLAIFRGLWRAHAIFSRERNDEMAAAVAMFTFGFIGYLTAAMFIHGAYIRYFWLLAGMALALPAVARSFQAERRLIREKGMRQRD